MFDVQQRQQQQQQIMVLDKCIIHTVEGDVIME